MVLNKEKNELILYGGANQHGPLNDIWFYDISLFFVYRKKLMASIDYLRSG